MGREIKVTCDSCGKDVYGSKYVTLAIRKVIKGKQTKFPTIWLCPKCYRETRLAMVLSDMGTDGDEE